MTNNLPVAILSDCSLPFPMFPLSFSSLSSTSHSLHGPNLSIIFHLLIFSFFFLQTPENVRWVAMGCAAHVLRSACPDITENPVIPAQFALEQLLPVTLEIGLKSAAHNHLCLMGSCRLGATILAIYQHALSNSEEGAGMLNMAVELAKRIVGLRTTDVVR